MGIRRLLVVIGVLLATTILAAATPVDAGVSVSLQPADSTVGLGAIFKIFVHVDTTGSEFNGYLGVIRWDPEIIDFVSVQPESLFGHYDNFWWAPEVFPDHVLISHVILEGNATETGPGDLSSITFTASALGVSPVAFDSIEFYLFGNYVLPVEWRDAIVRVADPTSGAPEEETGRLGQIRVVPNPAGRQGRLLVSAPPGEAARVRLFDVSGRLVWERSIAAGSALALDLGSTAGLRGMGSGVFFAQLVSGGRSRAVRFLRIDP